MNTEITPCVGCDETVDALYCSWECMENDDGKVMESPLTDHIYYVTEWTEKDDGNYIAHEKKRVKFPDKQT